MTASSSRGATLKTRFWLAVALAAASMTVFALPVQASHTTSCVSYSGPNFASYAEKVPSNPPTGVRATFEGQALDVCSGTQPRANLVWVAVVGPAGDGNAIVQGGRAKCWDQSSNDCDGIQIRFWAWGRTQGASGCSSGVNTVPPRVQYISTWTSGSDSFIVARDGIDWEVFVGGVLEASVPQASVCWTKQAALWAGESFNPGDAIGGSAANNYALTSAFYQTAVAGSWLSPAFAAGSNCVVQSAKYRCVTPGATSAIFWTVQ